MKSLIIPDSSLSSIHWLFTFLSEEECPKTLLQALQLKLPHIEASSWFERLMLGGTYINGKVASQDCVLVPPCKIEYFELKCPLDKTHEMFPNFKSRFTIFEDEYLLAVYKPSGLPCLATREQKKYNLKTYLETHLGRSDLHFPSRLDTAASGLILVSKSTCCHKPLQHMYERKEIQKCYWLEVLGMPDWFSLLVEKPITRDERHPVLRKIISDNEQESKPAITVFRVLKSSSLKNEINECLPTTIIEASPLTGKTHQIRLHASYLGFPIIGDIFYAGFPAAALHLLSQGIRFRHPIYNTLQNIELPTSLLPEWANSNRIF